MQDAQPRVPALPAKATAPALSLPRPWSPEELALDDRGLRPAAHLLLAAIALVFVAGVVWAAFAEMDEVTRGEGKIITSSQTQLVQNLEGGIIAEILVREGELVQKDQPLFRIDPTRHVSEFQGSQQEALALKAKIARLAAESAGASLQMPEEVRKAEPVLAANEAALYEARQADLSNRVDMLREQMAQRRQELVEVRGRAQRLDEGFTFLSREIAMTAPLAKEGVVSEVEVLRLERESARMRAELDGARLAMPRIEAAISEAKHKMQDLALAFRSQSGGELADAKAKLAKLDENLPALKDRVARAEVRSPVRGIVKLIPNKTAGGVVQPGSPLAELVPFDEILLAEVRIRPADVAFVSVGQPAIVKIAAYDYTIYGGLQGKLIYLSGDSIQPPQGDPYFLAHVRTDSSAIEFQGRKLLVGPGMTVTADVLTGRKTVLHYVLKPINKARERALRER